MNSTASKYPLIWFLFVLAALQLVSCASVENQNSQGENVGFTHYEPRFYLFRESTKENGDVLKLVTLPDLSKPRSIKYKKGWGSVEFSFKIVNGVLSEFGQKADSKGPETLGAIASLGALHAGIITAEAAMLSAEAGISNMVAGGTGVVTFRFDVLLDVADQIENKPLALLIKIPRNNRDEVISKAIADMQNSVERLRQIGRFMVSDGSQFDLLAIMEETQKIVRDEILPRLKTTKNKLAQWSANVSAGDAADEAITASDYLVELMKPLQKFAPNVPEGIRIWEIVESGDGIMFKPRVIPLD